ncbi:TetR/AcrR family transcriptional regulator [Niallia sp. NCCP-28]|uniref:TetR/AcrR family transcriptional regulator n=1 Tax=Niallia sp. NCCP-28 TaxID=2934712 RepID=UPI00208C8E43|nr:TetR-like C-terminal domain-containing protein [Niallia sp. NCCP-28]GKU83579.1 TetR family transcriptional regulator [Niallia sp. NCCP-28]
MDNKKDHIDPRILRTRKLLRDAFIELIQEMDIQKISVNRLAERATINRVTFYLHYRDIPDMLEKMADDMIEDISMVLNQIPRNHKAGEEGDWSMMVKFLEHIAEHANFYKVILASKRIPIFRDRLLLFLRDIIVARIEKRGSNFLSAGVQKDILVWYDSAALIGTIIAWLQNDMPYTPAFLAKQFSLLHHERLNMTGD